MGQKIRPDSLRTGITKGWLTNWFSKKSNFKTFLEEDILVRKIIKGKISGAHGGKGVVRAIFEKGLPGQAVTTEVEIR